MTGVYAVCGSMIAAAVVLTVAHLVRSRTLVDRAVALDAVNAAVLNGLAVAVAASSGQVGVELLLLFGLLGFVGTVSIARFVERRLLDRRDRSTSDRSQT